MTNPRAVRATKLVAAALAALFLTLAVPGGDAPARAGAKPTGAKPAIVFVHGASPTPLGSAR